MCWFRYSQWMRAAYGIFHPPHLRLPVVWTNLSLSLHHCHVVQLRNATSFYPISLWCTDLFAQMVLNIRAAHSQQRLGRAHRRRRKKLLQQNGNNKRKTKNPNDFISHSSVVLFFAFSFTLRSSHGLWDATRWRWRWPICFVPSHIKNNSVKIETNRKKDVEMEAIKTEWRETNYNEINCK